MNNQSIGAYPLGEHGVIVGTLFYGQPYSAADASLTQRCQRLRGPDGAQHLVDRYWGRYVAFMLDEGSGGISVLRDPSGTLPCYFTTFRGVSVVFSYIGDCTGLPQLNFTVNWPFIRSRIALGAGRKYETALREVSEVYPGEQISFSPTGFQRRFLWHPASIANSSPLEDPREASEAVHNTVRRVTHAWASVHDGVLHELSGGLDSSIVLGCLADNPTRSKITAVTYYMPGGFSDERRFARAAAQFCGCELVEHPRDPRIVDFRRILSAAPSVSPDFKYWHLELADSQRQLARQVGASAITTGLAGDAVFGATGRKRVALDYACLHGVSLKLFELAMQEASFRNVSVWKVMNDAIRMGVLTTQLPDQRRAYESQFRKLVHPDVSGEVLREAIHNHPWAEQTHLVLPGTRAMYASLMRSWDFYNPFAHPDSDEPEPVNPLASQPVVELALRIPSYVHNDGGRSRGLARTAFGQLIPQEVRMRQWKDLGVDFAESIQLLNIAFIREMLLDGILVREQLIRRAPLELALKTLLTRENDSSGPPEIADYLIVETWLRSHSAHSEQAAA